MRPVKLRSMSASATALLAILLSLAIALPFVFYYATAEIDESALDGIQKVIVLVICGVYCVPIIILAGYIFYHNALCVIISERGASVRVPFKRQVFVPKENIGAYGLWVRGRDACIYFCAVPQKEILGQTEQCDLKSAMEKIVKPKTKNVYFLVSGNKKRIALIKSVLQQEPLNIDLNKYL